MAADVKTHLYEWSTTEGSNLPVGSTVVSTNLDDNLRMIQAVVRYLASSGTVASDTTTDIGAVDATFLAVSGTTTITGLGTVSAGVYKFLIFDSALTLTYNATSLRLPGNANITTATGDVALFLSLGSGNWNCLHYLRKSGSPVTAGSFSGLTAAIATNTIANGDYNQNWTWTKTTATKPALFIGETTASSATDAVILELTTAAASTAWPLQVKARTSQVFAIEESGAVKVSSAGGFWLSDTPIKVYAATAPTITAGGGTGGAITGTDTAFQVEFGTGSATTVTVDFHTAYAAAPMVFVTGTQASQTVYVESVSTTQVKITSNAAFTAGTKVNVLCIEQGA
ncbi:MAG: hypothetical protein IPI51_07765 [Betaproteobacteria bacterium]|jgi:hypothetical protein|nr:hypothetical protein [Betaproteobacteria bacterium]